MYLINQLGRLDIREFWNLEYYVIFLFVYFFNEKVNFLLVNKEKKSSLNWSEELKKKVNEYYVIFEIPEFEKTQSAKLIDELQWTLVIVNLVLSPILFTNERCLLFSM